MRTESCDHIQTFDLHSAVFSLTLSEMFKNKNWFNAKRKGWAWAVHELRYENNFRCPVCRLTGPLYIDLTVTAALACLPASVTRVAFTESGRFMAVEDQQVVHCGQCK